MCDFQIDYRFFNSKSSTIETKNNMKMKCDFKCIKCHCRTLLTICFKCDIVRIQNDAINCQFGYIKY